MILCFFILFKIVPRGLDKKEYGKYLHDCGSNLNENENFDVSSQKLQDYNIYAFCREGSKIILVNCVYNNIITRNKYIWESAKFFYYGLFVQVVNSELEIANCTFTTMKCWNRLISLEGDNSKLTMNSNEFTNYDAYTDTDAVMVYSDAASNIITNNFVTNSVYQAFSFKHFSGLEFTYNTLSIQNSKGIINFGSKTSNRCPNIDHCTFKDCNINTKIIYIGSLNEDYTITNLTFDNCKNIKGGYIFDISNSEGQHKLTMNQCKFLNLVGTIHGGIGLWFSNGQHVYTSLTFSDCEFDNVCSTVGNGGGAVCFDMNGFSNCEGDLTVDGCNFTNVHSNKIGGAILYRSKGKLIVDNCIFNNTYAEDDGGNAISVTTTDDDKETVSISSCTFLDFGNDKPFYSIISDALYIYFFNNRFSFSDKYENRGCIKLLKYKDIKFIGNTFTNSHVKDDLAQSSGIHFFYNENCPQLSVTIEDNTFDHISDNYNGRCFYIKSKKFSYISLKNNTIKNCPAGGSFFSVYFVESHDVLLIDSFNFISNDINSDASQVFIEYNSNLENKLNLKFSECNFTENTSPSKGSALKLVNTQPSLFNYDIVIYKCNFVDNFPKESGNILLIQYYQSFICEECKFVLNKDSNLAGEIIRVETGSSISGVKYASFIKCDFYHKSKQFDNEILIDESPNTHILISECNFNDCGTNRFIIDINYPVDDLQIKNNSFVFSEDILLTPAIYSLSSDILIFGNTFSNCASNIIQLGGSYSQNPFQLIENTFIFCYKGMILDTTFYIKPVINGNNFTNITLDTPLLQINLGNDVDSLSFIGNTFSNFEMNVESGGIGIEMESQDINNNIYVSYENCTFFNCKNKNNANPAGALHCGLDKNKRNEFYTISDCIFQKNDHAEKGGSIYVNLKNKVLIEKCKFIENTAQTGSSIYIKPDVSGDISIAEIIIDQCLFQQNNAAQTSSIYIESGSTKSIKLSGCTFEDDQGIYAENIQKSVEFNNVRFSHSLKEPSITVIHSKGRFREPVSIDFCIFDSCYGSKNKCFYLYVETRFIYLQNCVIQNMQESGADDYIGTIDSKETYLNLINNSFINNSCDSLYGGGVGLKFIELDSIAFMRCQFLNNTAKQNKSVSRPSVNGKNYFNGDGGAIQLGYLCDTYDVNIEFSDCIFKNNKAYRHGGALALQTYYYVTIEYCIFENNIADVESSSFQLLYNNYSDLKSQGRGGAIYINPSYTYDSTESCKPPTIQMDECIINNCEFKENNAYDGYAIYVEGDDPGVKIIVNENLFTDNYNEKNNIDGSNNYKGAVVTTEICILQLEQIKTDNTFNYSNQVNVKELSCVDHYGNPPTEVFSQSVEFSPTVAFSPSIQFSLLKTESSELTNDFESSNEHSEYISSNRASEPESSNDQIESSSNGQIESSSNDQMESSSNEQVELSSSKDIDEPTIPVEPSDDPANQDSLCILFRNDQEFLIQQRCEYISNNSDTKVYISIRQSNFTDYKNESHGGVALIKNSGFIIHYTYFTRCSSVGGGGGALYIQNTHYLEYNITIDNCEFIHCSACFGGAFYIYSSSNENGVVITNSTFIENYATRTSSSMDGELFGGSSVFITAKNVFIKDSKFVNAKGSKSSFKIYNVFNDDDQKSKLQESNFEGSNSNSILFRNCDFEVDDESTNSIYFVNGEKGSNIEVNDCKFKGKINKKAHYIDGKLLSNRAPDIHVKGCEFELDSKSAINVALINEDSQVKDVSSSPFFFLFAGVMVIILSVAINLSVGFLVAKMKNQGMNEDQRDFSNSEIDCQPDYGKHI